MDNFKALVDDLFAFLDKQGTPEDYQYIIEKFSGGFKKSRGAGLELRSRHGLKLTPRGLLGRKA